MISVCLKGVLSNLDSVCKYIKDTYPSRHFWRKTGGILELSVPVNWSYQAEISTNLKIVSVLSQFSTNSAYFGWHESVRIGLIKQISIDVSMHMKHEIHSTNQNNIKFGGNHVPVRAKQTLAMRGQNSDHASLDQYHVAVVVPSTHYKSYCTLVIRN